MRNQKKVGRRHFLKSSGAGVTGLALISHFDSLANAQAGERSARRTFALNHNWLFSEKNLPNATRSIFNDATFKRVTIPHTNKMLPWHGFDDKEYEFASVYRRHFRPPATLRYQRVFVDFGGVMTAATVWINGEKLGEYRGGYTPFSFELTSHINWRGDNVLAVEVDSTERKDIPPFGNRIDYLTFGGIYREVQLRFVNQTFIENVFAKPMDVLSPNRNVQVRVFLDEMQKSDAQLTLTAELLDGKRVIASQRKEIVSDGPHYDLTLANPGAIDLWSLEHPKLYDVRVKLTESGRVVDHIDQYDTRIGFREAKFTPEGFYLNGKHLKLRGLNRHQTFPFVGQAMPARVQKRDAWILRKELHCNIVRTSHYPQSTHFLDACDEYGLLVFEEIPGWQHIGNDDWQKLAWDNVDRMVRRDWNHPSIILWGVRVNESGDNHDLYTKTNALAHSLDDSRPTGGVRYRYNSERLEDVFTMNDFGFPLRPPNHPLYLNTEFNGHMYPTKRNDNVERLREHTHRHARVHDQLASDDKYAGGLGWCAFDYNTHDEFGSGDRICYHGVSDIFRIPKPAAGFYKSQCDPSEEIVLEPAFDWARGDENETFTNALVCSNCEKLKFYIGERLIAEVEPDRKTYKSLKYAPFVTNLHDGVGRGWADLRIEGYIGGKKVIERKMSGRGADRQLIVEADDKELIGDGIDMTRVVMKVADEFGAVRPFANGPITLTLEGPGEIIGENPFALFGGVGAVWIRTKQSPGNIRLTAKHQTLGAKFLTISVRPIRSDYAQL
ncbi:MAG TPA: glycoside hydrolase family 2 TIM barrel-domain containing protein [Pyrinomonadaceae bacterium]|nr:glycoside hydrolase family 2 TIM barrel-domain containing protein [Pyrinomonadaceae bacterium]